MSRCRAGAAAGEEIVAGMTTRPPLSCVKQSATSGRRPAPVGGAGWHDLRRFYGGETEAGPAPCAAGIRYGREGEQLECVGWCHGHCGPTSYLCFLAFFEFDQ